MATLPDSKVDWQSTPPLRPLRDLKVQVRHDLRLGPECLCRLCLRIAVFVEKGVDSLRGPECACVKLAGATQSIKSFRPKRLRRVNGCACPKSAIQELSTG